MFYVQFVIFGFMGENQVLDVMKGVEDIGINRYSF